MIHVAPCSCELHVRIRELEREKALTQGFVDLTERARAEKAEAERDEALAKVTAIQARVADLRERLRHAGRWNVDDEAREREPCSCELHVRIRELEAELAYIKSGDYVIAMVTRAENAEKVYAVEREVRLHAEARVAELEREREDHLAVLDRHALMPECAEEHHKAREREASE